ncbi:MAG: YheT family hydrolase [Pseudomonadales bacterium]
MDFRPHILLRSPHLQTVLSSRLLRLGERIAVDLNAEAELVTIPCRDGIRLQALVNAQPHQAPLVVLIHGWLGSADAPYLRRALAALHAAGFSVARLLLRDHGGTAHLNEGLFNAARIDEVVDACNWLAEHHASGACGLMGYSLGGNFVLRLAAHPDTSPRFRAALAVCPVLDPAASVIALDRGWIGYRRYFVGKWRRAFDEKRRAFPERFDSAVVHRLSMVATVTDYFVSRYTPFRDADEYYSHYTLGRAFLRQARMPMRILSTEDDPVLPAEHARALLGATSDADVVTLIRHGGHCGFVEDFRLTSPLQDYAVRYFDQHR